jgi:hypothetical protein
VNANGLAGSRQFADAGRLQALQGYYYDGEAKLTDEEFENLKDDLIWSGSKIAVLSSNEQRFLEATIADSRGKPFLTDDEYDELKAKLIAENSVVTRAGPRCSIRSKRMYSDAIPDYLKLTLLNLPAALLVLGAIFSVDDLTGFEITKAIELPPPYNILFLWGLVFPTIYVLASSLTNFILPDALILKADCPECGTSNQAYFGGIFTVAGNRRTTTVECSNCTADLEFEAAKRRVVVQKSSDQKKQEEQEKAQKKKEAAAKKKAKAAAKKKEEEKQEA